MIGRDDFHKYVDHYENADNAHNDDIGDHIGVQHVTNIVPTNEAHSPSFNANTWDNIVDSSNVKIPFSSSWVWGMNFSKGLIFPNKEAVR